MSEKFFQRFALAVVAVLFSMNLYSQGSTGGNLYDDSYVELGAGLTYHYFSKTDDFRKASGLFGNDDKISYVIGLQLNAELMLNKTFSLSLPFDIGAGYRFQTMSNKVKYSTTMGYEIEKKVELINNIGYLSLYIPLDNEKYWLLGGSVGFGASKYSLSWEYENPLIVDTKDSSTGTVIPLSVFLDWGADGLGGRFGYTYVMSKYSDIDGSKPEGNGSQFFIDIRYAF